MRLLVAGSRSFTDYRLFTTTLKDMLQHLREPLLLISGGAAGADKMTETYARTHDLPIRIHYPDWKRHGRKAGYLRNIEMVNECTHLLAFWDGKSSGTNHTISVAARRMIPSRVVRFTPGPAPAPDLNLIREAMLMGKPMDWSGA